MGACERNIGHTHNDCEVNDRHSDQHAHEWEWDKCLVNMWMRTYMFGQLKSRPKHRNPVLLIMSCASLHPTQTEEDDTRDTGAWTLNFERSVLNPTPSLGHIRFLDVFACQRPTLFLPLLSTVSFKVFFCGKATRHVAQKNAGLPPAQELPCRIFNAACVSRQPRRSM